MKRNIENEIYNSIIGLCEQKEHEGIYRGNGHHLAQALCVKIAEGLLSKKQKTIYNSLTNIPQTTKEIGNNCGIDSKNVSSQLLQICKSTSLIAFKNNGRIKLWYRYYQV
jgi:DNA-binding CsgD family transcriptional regulator